MVATGQGSLIPLTDEKHNLDVAGKTASFELFRTASDDSAEEGDMVQVVVTLN